MLNGKGHLVGRLEVNTFDLGEGVNAEGSGVECRIVLGEVSCVARVVIGFSETEGMRRLSGMCLMNGLQANLGDSDTIWSSSGTSLKPSSTRSTGDPLLL